MGAQEQRVQQPDEGDNAPEPDQADPETMQEGPELPRRESEPAFPDEWQKDVPERGHGEDVG